MSLEESLVGTSPGETQQPEMATSSSSVSSNVNGQSERLMDSSLSTASSSQSSLLQPTSLSLDGVMQILAIDALSPSGTSTPDVDPQIIKALKSKDRLFVLKLGEQMEGLIRERHSRTKVLVTTENSYQRLLVHRCAAYYKLTPESDPVRSCFSLHISVESRLPARRISELVPSEQASHPQFKIMRRDEQDRRRQKSSLSRAGSVAGEDADCSDREPSEAGSMGGRSNASKKRSLAEREAAYLEARARIFHDLEEKEKANERGTSASSSTLSLASASGSGSQSGGAGGSNVDDLEDDNVSTAPTESEWSAPTTANQGRTESNINSAGLHRSRSSPHNSYNGSAHASGRTSPNAFNYASISDPSHPPPPFDSSGYSQQGGYVPPYPVFYPPPGQPPVSYSPYAFYPPYPYLHPPPHAPHAASDPVSPVTAPVDGYTHHLPSQSVPYMHPAPYVWQTSPPPIPGPHMPMTDGHTPSPGPSPQIHAIPPQAGIPPVQYPPQPFPSYLPPCPGASYGPYPAQGYHQQPASQGPPMTHPHSQPVYPIELPPSNGTPPEQNIPSGPPSGMSSGTSSPSPTLSRRSNGSHQGGNGFHHHNSYHSGYGHNHGVGHPSGRGAWSYGPGVGMHHNVASYSHTGGEVVGPRLSLTVRRTSGASSGSNGNRTPGDETASTTSSSTSSSSSRRTYMSNMSAPSKHPLPPRPDWAAGLRAQPTLHPPRSRHDSNNSRNMSPARPPGGAQMQNQSQQPQPQQLAPIFLQSTDFPPLTSMSTTDKRPSVGGAWTNPKSTARTILTSNSNNSSHGQGGTYANALFNHGGTAHGTMASQSTNTGVNRLEDDERGFERPPPKTNTELFNPKGGVKRGPQATLSRARAQLPPSTPSPAQSPDDLERNAGKSEEKDKARGEAVATAILAEKVSSLNIQNQSSAGGIDEEDAGSGVTGESAQSLARNPVPSTKMRDAAAGAAEEPASSST